MDQVAAMYNSTIKKPSSVFSSMLQEKLANTTDTIDMQGANTVGTEATNNVGNVSNAGFINELQNLLNSNTQNNLQSGDYCLKCGIPANLVNQNNAFNTLNTFNGNSHGLLNATNYPQGRGVSDAIRNQAMPYMDIINKVSAEQGMPADLIMGIIKAESNFNNSCVSYAGAKGLMQLMPETAAEVGVTDEFDPAQNIEGSVKYINKLIDRYDGDVKLALAAYNTGPGKIARRGVVSSNSPEYLTVPQSIRDYADRVLRYAGYQE